MAQEPLPTHPTSQVVIIDAEPTPISIDLVRTAVLVIDRSNHEASLLIIQTLLGWVPESSALIHALP